VPGFDGNAESFDWWEIQWNSFAEVENLNEALGKNLNVEMPANSKVDIKNTTEEGKKHAIPLQEMIKENYIKVCKKDITP